jgi:hypothetical protein
MQVLINGVKFVPLVIRELRDHINLRSSNRENITYFVGSF